MGGGFERGPDLTGEQIKQITDTNTLIQEALKNGALSGQEGKEIMARLNAERAEITQETKQKLNNFLQSIQGWDGLKKAAQKVSTKPIEATPAEAAPAPAPAPAEAAPAPAPVPVPAPAPAATEEVQPSLLDKARNFVSGKLDITSLPPGDQATIRDLQDAGFTLKPVTNLPRAYEVDMNGIGDKSRIDLLQKTFTTDALKVNGKEFTTSFIDSADAKTKLENVNKLINVNAELKGIPELSGHRDFTQESQHQKLTAQKAVLEKDLGIPASASAAALA